MSHGLLSRRNSGRTIPRARSPNAPKNVAKTAVKPKTKPKPKLDRPGIKPGPIYEETGFTQYSPNISPLALTAGMLNQIPVGSPVAAAQVNPPYGVVYNALGMTEAMVRAKTRVMRADLAAMWACYTVNRLSLHITNFVRPTNVALESTKTAAEITSQIYDELLRIASEMAQVFPQHMMDQRDDPPREPRTGPARKSHTAPKAYPAGGPLKLPVRPANKPRRN